MFLPFPVVFLLCWQLCHPSLAWSPTRPWALRSLFMCVRFQIYKQRGPVPRSPSWVPTPKCQWCLEADKPSVGGSISLASFSLCPCSGKACVTLDRARTAQSSNPAPSLIGWVMWASDLNFLKFENGVNSNGFRRIKWDLEHKVRKWMLYKSDFSPPPKTNGWCCLKPLLHKVMGS